MLIRRQLLYNPLAIEGRAAALVLGADSHAWLLCISSLESRLIRAVHAVRAGTAVMHVHAVYVHYPSKLSDAVSATIASGLDSCLTAITV